MIELCHSIAIENPPALTGGARVQAIDRVIHRALEKQPANRYSSAAEMARALESSIGPTEETVKLSRVETVRRLIVLPFRLLRPDEEIEFLTFSLPDALTSSLYGLDTLVVRSSRLASQWADADPDPKTLAKEADVDVALLGTLMRAGDQVRLKTQLVETPSGTVRWSRTLQVPLGNIFRLEDELRDRLLESLAITLTEKEQIKRPASPGAHAYELFLRANQLGFSTISTSRLVAARDLYRASLDEDPEFAPAWARLGRVYRIMAKYGHGDADRDIGLAEEAFRRALEIDPDLPIAHSYYTYFEVESGRAPEAMIRLLEQLRRHTTDPELYAGLIVACRFCGLTDASIAADQRAKRLDPTIATSVHYTHWMAGDLEKAIELDRDEVGGIRAAALWELGRIDEAKAIAADITGRAEGVEDINMNLLLAGMNGNRADAEALAKRLRGTGFRDPEGFYLMAFSLAFAGSEEMALEFFQASVRGHFCAHALMERQFRDRPIWNDERFQALIEESRTRHERARRMFLDAGGDEL